MNSYLYIWNPLLWEWVDLPDAICRIANGEPYDRHWSCGNTKKIEIGDRFFLMRVGVEPKGIVACGYVSSTPYELAHWDAKKAKNGLTSLRTDLLFKALSDQPMISINQLKTLYPTYNWSPQVGGLSVPAEISIPLFEQIQQNPAFSFLNQSTDEIRLYTEGKCRTVSIKSYDRNVLAREACIKYYGYGCVVCTFDFEKTYGALGKNYIEVHHLKPIADIGAEYLIDPIKDLRPVCANCHRMLHRQRPPLSIEELLSVAKPIQTTGQH